MTGAEYYQILLNKWDESYNAYLPTDTANRIIKESLYRVAEKKYSGLVTQKIWDELTSQIVVSSVVPITNGRLFTRSLQIVGASELTDTITIVTSQPHNLAIADPITISGVLGGTITNVNGSFAVDTIVSSTSFTYTSVGSVITGYTVGSGEVVLPNMLTNYYHHLKSVASYYAPSLAITSVITGSTTTITAIGHNYRVGDSVVASAVGGVTGLNGVEGEVIASYPHKFTVNITTTGTYTSGGTVALVIEAQGRPYTPQLLTTFSGNDIVFKVNQTHLSYPTWVYSVAIDYMTTLPIEIDVTNAVIDLERFYSFKLLMLLADECMLNYAAITNNPEAYGTAQNSIAQNP